jgi:hypothetical protein
MECWLADFKTWIALLTPAGGESEPQVKEVFRATLESIESVRATSEPPIEWYARPSRLALGTTKEALPYVLLSS